MDPAGSSVIDLGVYADAGEPVPRARRVAYLRRIVPRVPDGYRRRDGVRWTAGIVAVISLLLLGGSVPQTPRLVRVGLVPARLLQPFDLFDDGVYLTDEARTTSAAVTVDAFNLDGTHRWTRTIPGSASGAEVFETASVTVVSVVNVDGPNVIVANDRTDGHQLWTGGSIWGDGDPNVLASDRTRDRLLVAVEDRSTTNSRSVPDSRSGPEDRLDPDSTTLYWMDARTGRAVWTAPLPLGWAPDPHGSTDRVLRVLGANGLLTTIDLTDAGTRRSVVLLGLPTTDHPVQRQIAVVGATVVVSDEDGTDTSVYAYSATTYALLWSDVLGRAVDVAPCGRYLCELGDQGFVTIDAVTGQQLWRTGPVLSYPFGDRFFTEPFSAPGIGPPSVLDATSGRVVADLTGWQVAAIVDGTTILLMAPRRGVTGRWLGELDSRTHEISILGMVPALSSTCAMTVAHLACQLYDGTIVVWRLTG